MIQRMALTPGGGRSPSTKPPPAPTPSGQPRPTRDSRPPRTTSQAASFSILRWGLLIGGLVIIVDLASLAVSQRTVTAEDLNVDALGAANLIDFADLVINVVLFSVLGVLVVRDSGLMQMGAIAGLFASLLDALVVVTATTMAPPAGPPVAPEDQFLFNVAIGTVFAGIGGVVFATLKRWSGGRRQQ
jgi:hypothetical protein